MHGQEGKENGRKKTKNRDAGGGKERKRGGRERETETEIEANGNEWKKEKNMDRKEKEKQNSGQKPWTKKDEKNKESNVLVCCNKTQYILELDEKRSREATHK